MCLPAFPVSQIYARSYFQMYLDENPLSTMNRVSGKEVFDNWPCCHLIILQQLFNFCGKTSKYIKCNFYWRAKIWILVLISDLVSSPLTVVCLRLCSTEIRTSHLSVSVLSADFVSSILSNCHHRPAPPTFTFD